MYQRSPASLRAAALALLVILIAPGFAASSSSSTRPIEATPQARAVALAWVSVSGVVWQDLDCDGVREAGEPPFVSETVELYKEVNPGVWSRAGIRTTDSNGAFLFQSVQPSWPYRLKFLRQVGYHFAPADVGSDDTDSDAYADGWTDGWSDPLVITAPVSHWDAGLCGDYAIAGAKWHDLNGDGDWDSGEPALSDWTINLQNAQGNVVIATTGTGGVYSFPNLMPGTYTVTEGLQAGWRQTYPGGDSSHRVTLGHENADGIDFGNQQLGGLDVHKVIEWNGVTEEPVEFTVCIQGPSFPTTPNCKTLCSAAGWTASWVDLIPGTYTVTENNEGAAPAPAHSPQGNPEDW